MAQYASSGSQELARNTVAALEERNAALMMNHGIVGVGKDIREAFTVCEMVEKIAQAFFISSTLGEVNLLSKQAIESGLASFHRSHG